MSQDPKQVRRVASCIRTLVESAGHKVRVKDIVAMIEGEDLDNIEALRQKVTNDLQTRPAVVATTTKASSRRQNIETFITNNWDTIKDNPDVRSGLLHLYSMGRLTKVDRKNLVNGLLQRLGEDVVDTDDTTDQTTDQTTTPTTSVSTEADQAGQELLSSLDDEGFTF